MAHTTPVSGACAVSHGLTAVTSTPPAAAAGTVPIGTFRCFLRLRRRGTVPGGSLRAG